MGDYRVMLLHGLAATFAFEFRNNLLDLRDLNELLWDVLFTEITEAIIDGADVSTVMISIGDTDVQ